MSSAPPKTRRDPRREAARIALIEAAETLFAEGGIESVSLRQIGAAIGSSNNGVVTYYFGTKEALVEAIYFHRVPALERRRAELLAAARATGADENIEDLMRVLCLPLLELTNGEGRHSYAGFLASVARSGGLQIWEAMTSEFPTTQEIIQRIERLSPAEARSMFAARLRISVGMMTSALSIIDHNTGEENAEFANNIFEDTIRMMTTAICTKIP